MGCTKNTINDCIGIPIMRNVICAGLFFLSLVSAKAQSLNQVNILTPKQYSDSISAVEISATSKSSVAHHLEVWDNGWKLGDVFSDTVDDVYVLPNGGHYLVVQSVSNQGVVLAKSFVNFTVVEPCVNSATQQCNMEQLAVNNVQNDCNPAQQIGWVANSCGDGIQGVGGSFPISTALSKVTESGSLSDQNNKTLNGNSLYITEQQGTGGYSNVLFRGQSPSKNSFDSHWNLDTYVYLPNPKDHQALEIDAQATIGYIWSKFAVECAFNIDNGKGYWAVFDTNTGGWIFLNGKNQNGQTPPVVACNQDQFSQPWIGSSNPNFTGWHHIVWSFFRNPDGTVTFENLVFDKTKTDINFTPISASGGVVGDTGNFSALIQLDGAKNVDHAHNLVDLYVNEINITHTP